MSDHENTLDGCQTSLADARSKILDLRAALLSAKFWLEEWDSQTATAKNILEAAEDFRAKLKECGL